MPYKTIIDNLKDKTVLKLENQNIGEDDIQALAEELKGTLITTLDLSNNSIGCNGLKKLVQVLSYTKISELNLRNNDIKDEGVKYLSEFIENTEITHLDLEENIIGIDTAQYLWEKLSNTKIRNLYFHIYYETDGNVHKFIKQSLIGDIKNTYVTINNNKIGIQGARYLNKTFQTIGIAELELNTNKLHENDVQHLTQAFNNIKIGNFQISLDHIMQFRGIEYLIKVFKNSYIVKLSIQRAEKIWSTGAKYLAEFLKKVKVLNLDLRLNHIGDEGVKYLAPALKNSDIMYIDLAWNSINFEGARYLAETLRDSKILHIDLCNNNIGAKGAKYLADGLSYSQVTDIHLHGNSIEYAGYENLIDIVDNTNISWVNLNRNNIEEGLEEGTKDFLLPYSLPRNTTSIAYRLRRAFKELVSLNLISNEFEFNVPKKNTHVYPPVNIDEYPFLIQTLNDDPNSKVHIFDLMCKTEFNYYDLDIMNKINVFIEIMPNKFNTFIENELPNFIESFGFDIDKYVKLVKEFAEMRLHEVVQNLLLHRVLYYIDENQEILHPYIYKMLDKYSMPLYNAQLEPHKKEKIISYFQNHQEIDGVQEIVDLLESVSFY